MLLTRPQVLDAMTMGADDINAIIKTQAPPNIIVTSSAFKGLTPLGVFEYDIEYRIVGDTGHPSDELMETTAFISWEMTPDHPTTPVYYINYCY